MATQYNILPMIANYLKDQIAKAKPAQTAVNQALPVIGNAITQGANTVGKTIGQAQVGVPGVATTTPANVSKTINQLTSGDENAQADPLLSGQAKNVGDIGMSLAAPLMMIDGKPEDIAPAAEEKSIIGTRTKAEIQTDIKNQVPYKVNSGQNPQLPPITTQEGKIVTDGKGNPLSTKPNLQFSNNNLPTTPLNPNTEVIPEKQILPQEAQSTYGQPKTPPADPYARTYPVASASQENSSINAMRPLAISKTKVGIQTPQEADQVHATLNGYGITSDSPETQLRGIEEQKGKLSDQTQQIYKTQGGTLNKQNLIDNMAHKFFLNNEFEGKEKEQAAIYVDSLYKRATGKMTSGMTNDTASAEIPGEIAGKMKQIANDDSGRTFGRDPSVWKDSEKSARAGRDTITEGLNIQYPEAMRLNNDLSDMYDAEHSLIPNANKEISDKNIATRKAIQDKENTKKEPNFLQKHALPLILGGVTTALTAGVGTGVYAGPKIAAISDAKKANGGDGNTLSPLKEDPYKVTTPLDDGTIMDENTHGTQQGLLKNKIDAEAETNPVQADADRGTYDENEINFKKQANLLQKSSETKNVIDSANSAAKGLRGVDLGFLNALSKGYDNTAMQNNPNYHALGIELQNLQSITGMKLSDATNLKTLQAGIDKAVAIQQRKLEVAKHQYSARGNDSPPPSALPLIQTSQAAVNWKQNDPRVQTILNQ